MNEKVNKCYSCEFHRQECIFTFSSSAADDVQSKKRKLEETRPEDAESVKRYAEGYGS